MVYDNPIYLLSHIPRLDTCLNMSNWNAQFHGVHGVSQCTVGIVVDDGDRRPIFQNNLLHALKCLASLILVETRTNIQIIIGFGNVQFFKENIAELEIVMLFSMNSQLITGASLRGANGGQLNEVWSGPTTESLPIKIT